jgi:zinc transport system substrate-binding protein
MKEIFLVAFLIIALTLLPQDGIARTRIVASIFPFYDFVREIVKDNAQVELLIKPGTNLHHFEPKPSDIATIRKADFFIYGGLKIEPWAERIVRTFKTAPPYIVNASQGLDLESTGPKVIDPHIWLDPYFVERIVDNIVENLAMKDQKNAEFFRRNGDEYKRKVKALDERFKQTLASCKIRTIVHAGHYSFGYLAKRYNLEYVTAYPLEIESEPTPQQIRKMKETLQRTGARYIFYEEFVSQKVANILARELKLGMLKLNSGGIISKKDLESGVTFLKIMEDNLKSLARGLECEK